MNYKELQDKLRVFKSNNETTIKLNSSYAILLAEYERLTIKVKQDTPKVDARKAKFRSLHGKKDKQLLPKKDTVTQPKKDKSNNFLYHKVKHDPYTWFMTTRVLVDNVLIEHSGTLERIFIDINEYLPSNFNDYEQIKISYRKIEVKVKSASFDNRRKTKLKMSDNTASNSRDKKHNNAVFNAVMGYEIDTTYIASIVLIDRYGGERKLLNRLKADPTHKVTTILDDRVNKTLVHDQRKIDKAKIDFNINNTSTVLYDTNNNRYELRTIRKASNQINTALYVNSVLIGTLATYTKKQSRMIAHKEYFRDRFINDPDLGITITDILSKLDSGVDPIDLINPKNNLQTFRKYTVEKDNTIDNFIEFTRISHLGYKSKLTVKLEQYNYKLNKVFYEAKTLGDLVIDDFIGKIVKRLQSQDINLLMSIFDFTDTCVIGGRSNNPHKLSNQKIKKQKSFMIKLWENKETYKGVSLNKLETKQAKKLKYLPIDQLVDYILKIGDCQLIADQSDSTITTINKQLGILGYALSRN